MVITKDLSRLGRDYIETGEYVEKWFPEKKVRYVSVNDGVDTFAHNNGNNDIAPFKAILNDMYSKDLSKKIKSAFATMQTQGKWLGGMVPLGYRRDPEDKNHLIIQENEAKIVRKIFDMAIAGNRLCDIKKYLNDNEIPTLKQLRSSQATFWENKSIKNILKNEVYIGNTIQNKYSRISYKNRKLRPNPKEEWRIVENTHEAIIDKKTFDNIQKMVIVQNYGRNEKKHNFLLDGLLFCYECNHTIGFRNQNRGTSKNTPYMICNNYRRNSSLGLCTSHGFNYLKLEESVLETIKNLFQDIDSKKIELNYQANKTTYDYDKMLKKLEIEVGLIHDKFDKMYMDKLDNKISEEMYLRLSNKLKREIEEKNELYEELNRERLNAEEDNDKELEKIIQNFLNLEKPNSELMRVIVHKILIHQDKQVDVVFNFRKLNRIKNATV